MKRSFSYSGAVQTMRQCDSLGVIKKKANRTVVLWIPTRQSCKPVTIPYNFLYNFYIVRIIIFRV